MTEEEQQEQMELYQTERVKELRKHYLRYKKSNPNEKNPQLTYMLLHLASLEFGMIGFHKDLSIYAELVKGNKLNKNRLMQ